MSVVVYKDGVLASDSRAYGGSWQASPGSKPKVHTLPDGTRIGVTSAILGMPERFLAWYRAGAKPDKWGDGDPDLRALMVKPNGDVYLASNSVYFSGPLSCDSYAIGSGCDFALGAMAMGATAAQAVAVACKFDPHCGGEVVTV